MTVADLIAELQKLPPEMVVWVSEGGYVEGAMPLMKVEVEEAWAAALDGDEVDGEYHYVDCMDDPKEDLSTKGYELINNGEVWTKKIAIIKTGLDT